MSQNQILENTQPSTKAKQSFDDIERPSFDFKKAATEMLNKATNGKYLGDKL